MESLITEYDLSEGLPYDSWEEMPDETQDFEVDELETEVH
jgi:hypothetical protein